MKVISRKDYAERIDAWLGKELIIVLVGQRRVGKSFVMKDFVARHKDEPDSNIIYIDKEKKAFNFIKNHEDLNTYIDSHFNVGSHNYILIDEVQDIEGWEHSVTRKREFGTLRLIADDYPKYVISASPLLKRSDDEGVTHLHIREFLKNGLN